MIQTSQWDVISGLLMELKNFVSPRVTELGCKPGTRVVDILQSLRGSLLEAEVSTGERRVKRQERGAVRGRESGGGGLLSACPNNKEAWLSINQLKAR